MPIKYTQVLQRRFPGLRWRIEGEDYETLVMMDGDARPTQDDLDALWPEVEAEIAAEEKEEGVFGGEFGDNKKLLIVLETYGRALLDLAALAGVPPTNPKVQTIQKIIDRIDAARSA